MINCLKWSLGVEVLSFEFQFLSTLKRIFISIVFDCVCKYEMV